MARSIALSSILMILLVLVSRASEDTCRLELAGVMDQAAVARAVARYNSWALATPLASRRLQNETAPPRRPRLQNATAPLRRLAKRLAPKRGPRPGGGGIAALRR